ncbi:hypothetical protein ACRAWB_01925 [Leifsonia poae]|uniref:hypothetical protein n=1 Tax=Leifsonia poae TaxID=110933 RepID=UPI003D685C67
MIFTSCVTLLAFELLRDAATPAPANTENAAGTDPTAWIALSLSVVAILSQVFLRYLDGGRVRVLLRSALWDRPDGALWTVETGRWRIQPANFERLDAPFSADYAVELAQVVVENKGRHAVTVADVGLEWRGRIPGKLRSVRHHVVPRAFELPGHGHGDYVAKQPVRIEPADRVSFLFDYWNVFPPGRKSTHGIRIVRASAKIAGRRRRTLSSRRFAWKIADHDVSAVAGRIQLRLGVVVGRVLARMDPDGSGIPRMFDLHLSKEIGRHGWPTEAQAKRDLIKRAVEGTPDAALMDKAKLLSFQFALRDEIDRYRSHIDWPECVTPAASQETDGAVQ